MTSQFPGTSQTVVGWNGSASGGAALDWAVQREASRDGIVTLLRVVDERQISRTRSAREHEVDSAREFVAAEASRIRRANPGLVVTTEVRVGDPLRELQHCADPRWVVAVGTSARTGPHFRYGWSVGARLASTSAGPIAVVPTRHPTHRAGVVVGVDGSQVSLGAALFAGAEAVRRDEELLIVNAWLEPPVWTESLAFEIDSERPYEAESKRIVAQATDRVAALLPAVCISARAEHLPAPTALLEASRNRALLVVGNRATRGISRILLGSVSHAVIRDIIAPTIVIGQSAAEVISASAAGHG